MIAAGPVIPNFGQGSACVTGDHVFCWDWVRAHWGDTLEPHLVQHVDLTPGEYKVYAWEDVEMGAYMDPDFMKPIESKGEGLTLRRVDD